MGIVKIWDHANTSMFLRKPFKNLCYVAVNITLRYSTRVEP